MNKVKELKIEMAELNLKLSNSDYDGKIEELRKKINGHNVGVLFFLLSLGGMIFLLVKSIYPKGWLTMILIVLAVGVFAMIRLMILISTTKQKIEDIESEKEIVIQRISQLQKEIILSE